MRYRKSFSHVAFDDVLLSRAVSVKRDATETNVARTESFPSEPSRSAIFANLAAIELRAR